MESINCGPFRSLNLPAKPREMGITAAIDGGLPLCIFRDSVELSAEHLDFVKFGWASAAITNTLHEKIKILKDNDVQFWIGGTAFEIAYLEKGMDRFTDWVDSLDAKYLEISDGTIEFEKGEKVFLIRELSKRFRILSEIGSKDVDKVMTPREWVKRICDEKNAGAWKIVGEGRESGTAGIYRQTGEIREGLVEEIREAGIPLENIIFEAPQKRQQVWLIKRFSKEVNFGNIPLGSVLNLLALRLGLRADTVFLRSENNRDIEKQ